MKKMRRLIPAIAMLLVSAVMLSTASFAWFTIGTYATATGMSVTAEAASSLLIINGDDTFNNGVGTEITNQQTLKNLLANATNSVDFDREGANLQPATNDNGTLKTLVDATYVDQNKGGTLPGATYKNATEGTNFIEYTAYIAVAGVEMYAEGSSLKATVSLPTNVTSIDYLNNAVTVAFFVADSKNANVEYEGQATLLDVVTDGSVTVDLKTTTIPVGVTTTGSGDEATTTLDYVKVYIRVYYDGALVDASIVDEGQTTPNGTTYVRNSEIGTEGVAFNVRFDYSAPNT